MESFNDIKTLWHSDAVVSLPDMSEIENVMMGHSKKVKQINGILIFLLICCAATFLVLIAVAPFKMWTTYFGLIVFMGVTIYSIRLKIKKQRKFSRLETLSNNDFLAALEAEETQACSGKSRKIAILFSVWAIGFFFYIYEFVFACSEWLFIGYGSLIGLILILWFVYRPFMRKRYQKRIQKTIEKIQKLKTQIDENE